MADIPGAFARSDALVCEHIGGERLFAGPRRRRARGAQRRYCRERRGCLQRFARSYERTLLPRFGDGFDIDIGVTAREQARGAEFGQPRVDIRADGAELRVTAVT